MKNKFTWLHRMLHWSIAFIMVFLFITGLFHQTWMGKDQMANILQSKIPDIDPEFAVMVARSIRAPMFEWHVYASYIIVVLLIIRLIYMWTKGQRFANPLDKNRSNKERFEGGLYILFYIFMISNTITGFYHLWGTEPAFRKLSGTIHKWSIYWFPIFIFIHFAGIYLSERSNKKGVSSKMIGGDRL